MEVNMNQNLQQTSQELMLLAQLLMGFKPDQEVSPEFYWSLGEKLEQVASKLAKDDGDES